MTILKIAAAHCASILLDRDASIARACDMIEEAGAQGVDLLCFPETFVPGFPYWINLYAPGAFHPMHLRYGDQSVDLASDHLDPVRAAARAAGCAVVLGIGERDGGTLYNSQVFIGADGTLLGHHRKLQPTFAERTLWGQGDGSTLSVFDMAGARIGGLICYEHMSNLARHALLLDGMQIHCASWPTFATQAPRGAGYDSLVDTVMRAHAITGQCFVIVAENPVTQQYIDVMTESLGPQTPLTPGGGCSTIYGPAGQILAGPHTGPDERLVMAEIDLRDIRSAKLLADSVGHSARAEVLQLSVDRRAF